MPSEECAGCEDSFNSINGLFCKKIKRYVHHADTAQCEPRQQNKDMDNNKELILRPENMKEIVLSAPGSYASNKQSHDNCVNFGQKILDLIEKEGMNDELDKQAASFIEKARRTVKVMNERRSPVTKLFDEVRSAFTTIENEIDPSKAGTIGYRLQQLRNGYIAKKRAEEEKRRSEALARQRAAEAAMKFRVEVEEDLKKQFLAFLNDEIASIGNIDNNISIENYERSLQELKQKQDICAKGLPCGWLENLHTLAPIPSGLSVKPLDIVKEIKQKLEQQFNEQYVTEIGDTLNYVIDRMPSKRANLERIAKADAEESARMKQEMEARQKAEAERMERERAAREAEAKAKAEMCKQAAEMQSLFEQQATVSLYASKAKVTKKINLLNPEGIMPIISMWWSKEGCSMSVDELAKIFKKQITFCEKLANKEGVLINDESVEYVDEVKAK